LGTISDSGLRQLVDLFSSGDLKNTEVIGANSSEIYSADSTRKTVSLSYQVELSKGWLAGTVVIVEEGESRAITSARFNRYSASLEFLNRFTFSEKGPVHFAFFLLALAIPIFSLYSLVVCARTKMRRKWLWIIFILFGVATFRINWTTGQMDYQLLSFQLLGASVFKMGFCAPWIVSVAFPVGAIVFLAKRRKLDLLSSESLQPRPLPTLASGTPAARAPVAPPPGASVP